MTRRLTRRLLLVALLAGAILLPATARAQDDRAWLLNQINTLRGGLGLHAYSLNPQLTAAANGHSQYMATTCTVTHYQGDARPVDRARAAGYPGGWISENIYGGRNATAADAWNFWTNSGIHYQGLTHQVVNEVGIGIARSECGQYFTLLFGQRDEVNPPPAPVPAPADPGAEDPAPTAIVPPPTQRPYVPPPPSNTPTPTVPTLTPSATWTITPSRTPPPTATRPASTATPLVLPTVPALTTAGPSPSATAAAVAQAPSPTVTPPPTLPPTETAPPAPAGGASDDADDSGSLSTRDLVALALVGQIVLIGLAGVAFFRREK